MQGYALDDDELGEEPLTMPVPSVLPTAGSPSITGWPDPSPPVIDPATQAAWSGHTPETSETPERP